MQKIRGLIVAGVSLLAISSPALAQQADSDSDQEAGNEIVVTGRLVRGVQPTGTQVIGVDRGAVEATGASTVKDLAPTLGVNNVFDQDPPVRYVGGSVPSQFGYADGSTLGRLVQFGFSKKFWQLGSGRNVLSRPALSARQPLNLQQGLLW